MDKPIDGARGTLVLHLDKYARFRADTLAQIVKDFSLAGLPIAPTIGEDYPSLIANLSENMKAMELMDSTALVGLLYHLDIHPAASDGEPGDPYINLARHILLRCAQKVYLRNSL